MKTNRRPQKVTKPEPLQLFLLLLLLVLPLIPHLRTLEDKHTSGAAPTPEAASPAFSQATTLRLRMSSRRYTASPQVRLWDPQVCAHNNYSKAYEKETSDLPSWHYALAQVVVAGRVYYAQVLVAGRVYYALALLLASACLFTQQRRQRPLPHLCERNHLAKNEELKR